MESSQFCLFFGELIIIRPLIFKAPPQFTILRDNFLNMAYGVEGES